jgi:hypothetical protein
VALVDAQSDLCSGPLFSICVAAPLPNTYTSLQDACQQLTMALQLGGVSWPLGNAPVSVTCTQGVPNGMPPLPAFSPGAMSTLCATMPFLRMYSNLIRSTWSLNSPVDKIAFTQPFRAMFNGNGTEFGSFWSFFSCRLNPMMSGSVPQQWTLQFADRPAQFSPPPPSSNQRETFIISGSSTNRRLRALLEIDQATTGPDISSDGQAAHSGSLHQLEHVPDPLILTSTEAEGAMQPLSSGRKLLQGTKTSIELLDARSRQHVFALGALLDRFYGPSAHQPLHLGPLHCTSSRVPPCSYWI